MIVYLKVLLFELLLFIFIHELTHLVVIKNSGYQILFIRFLGFQLLLGNHPRITYSFNYLLDICVMGDYSECLNNEFKWKQFLHNINYILIAAPVVNLFLSIVTLVGWLWLSRIRFLWASCINLFIFCTCFFPGKNGRINDLECIFNKMQFDKDKLLQVIVIQTDSIKDYSLLRTKELTKRVVNHKGINDAEMLFISGILWKMIEADQIDLEYISFLHKNHKDMYYKNIYSFLLMLCMLSLCEGILGMEQRCEIDEIINKNRKRIDLLLNEASGVCYLVQCWENHTILNKLVYRKQYKKSMHKLGFIWV